MKKYLARLVLEAETPLHVGSGNSDLTLDAPVNCDANGLPQINGTSLAGVLKSAFMDLKGITNEKDVDESNAVGKFFGFKGENKNGSEKGGKGSRLVVSNAHLVYGKDKVVEGLMLPDEIQKNEYLSAMSTYALPLRDHCRINDSGSTADKGKFDNCVLPKGVRFVCELELTEYQGDALEEDWEDLLKIFASPMFRIGGKVRSGLGRLKVIECLWNTFTFPEGAKKYCEHSSSFNTRPNWNRKDLKFEKRSDKYSCYTLNIQPENFFTFGSGYGDDGANIDAVPKKEIKIDWENDEPEKIKEKEYILIPASSIKGAISHRVAYHYNKLKKQYIGSGKVGADNEAVKVLFGCDTQGGNDAAAGKVFFDDILIEKEVEEKIFDHVSIDRFTGGAKSGALFNEKVCVKGFEFKPMEIYVDKSAFEKDMDIKNAFEKTLDDICNGMLPLGGSTMRGHGCFTGTWGPKKEEKND